MTISVSRRIVLNAEAQLVAGAGVGEVLASRVPLSFWGGVDAASGEIIDRHHPLSGENLAGSVLVMPHGRGSCTGSAVLLETIHAGVAPALILLNRADEIIGLGAIVADEVLHRNVPVAVLDDTTFAMALQAQQAHLTADGVLTLSGDALTIGPTRRTGGTLSPVTLELTARDRRCLAGKEGPACRAAMRIIQRMARMQGACCLVDVSRVHVDGCIYTGPAGLKFAQQLAMWRGQVAVPTTLNAISIDRRQWQRLGIPESLAFPATRLADAYIQLGAMPTYTCAPYLLDDVPSVGECIAWAESNAVVYANSVLGARTNKTPDLLDICVALTGRAPYIGYYLDAGRQAQVVVDLPKLNASDDALYPLLGYVIGAKVNTRVPLVTGLTSKMSRDALKAFGAAFATTSSAGMFHIVGSTPEAKRAEAALTGLTGESYLRLSREDLIAGWRELDGAQDQQIIDLVALGNPHFSCEEFAELAGLCAGHRKHEAVQIIVTTNRCIAEQAKCAGHLAALESFGVQVITDTCWCMLERPIVGPWRKGIVTNSAKYAHYAPGLVGRQVHYASLADCVKAAIRGEANHKLPAWLANNVVTDPSLSG